MEDVAWQLWAVHAFLWEQLDRCLHTGWLGAAPGGDRVNPVLKLFQEMCDKLNICTVRGCSWYSLFGKCRSFSKGERLRCLLGYFSVPRGQIHTICDLGEWNLFSLKLWVEDDGLFWCCLPPPPNCNSVIFMLLRGFTLQKSQGRYPRAVLQVYVQLAIGCISVRKKTLECEPLLLSILIHNLLGAHKASNFKVCHYICQGKNTENLDW